MKREKIKNKKHILFAFLFSLFFFLSSFFAYSQPVLQPWWLSLEQGKQKFRNGDYGEALLSFEDARRNRQAMYEQMERDLINLLSINEVRRIGDSLDRVELYSDIRHYTAANAALNELYYRVPKASLHNSAAAALEAIGKLKNYPEAEYWIGEIYRIEGELALALSQYRKAYSMRELFEDPGFATELLYKIAAILLIRQEYNEMIRVLDSIINDFDTLWVNANQGDARRLQTENNAPIPYVQASASFASQAMTRTLEYEGIGRFLELYRYNNTIVEPAHRQLGFHYAITGRPAAQQHLMYSFLIQNTVIIDEIKRRKFNAFTDLSPNEYLPVIAQEINSNPLLLSYIEEVEYYKTIYYLGSSLNRNGKRNTALSFWSFLASMPQAREWHHRAVNQLRNPHLEPIVERP